MRKSEIMGVSFANVNMDEAVSLAAGLLKKKKKSSVFFLNEDCLYKAQKDNEYLEILNSADLVLPDGIGLKIIGMLTGTKVLANCNGTDFCPLLMEKAAGKKTAYFLGAKEGISEKAAKNMMQKFPGLEIAGWHSGYFKGEEEKEVIKEISKKSPDLLFVAMGAPKQEKWISKNRDKINATVFIGVGALFDFLSGNVRRAPVIFRKARLEWLWRMMLEPRRMFSRYIIDGTRLLFLAMKARFSKRKQ